MCTLGIMFIHNPGICPCCLWFHDLTMEDYYVLEVDDHGDNKLEIALVVNLEMMDFNLSSWHIFGCVHPLHLNQWKLFDTRKFDDD